MLARSEHVLAPVRPSAAEEAWLRSQLVREIAAMHEAVVYLIADEYRRQQERIIAQDDSPADRLNSSIKGLSKRWTERFDALSQRLAEHFSQAIEKRSTVALKRMLRKYGMSVRFTPSQGVRDIMDATVHQSVQLIKSIPQKYLGEVEGIVMRGVQVGRDLATISKALQSQFGVAKRRAHLIARDQNNKATAAFNRTRQLEAGLDEAIWIHSSAGKTWRPSHAKAGRERTRFKIATGWFDPDEGKYIQPGELINCRCVSRPVIKGFS
mgnify:CR=1 FL=1